MSTKTIVREILTRFTFETREAEERVKTINSQLKAIKASLKIEWDSKKYNQAMELAGEKTKLLGEQLDKAREKMKAMNEAPDVDKASKEYQQLTRKIIYLESAIEKAGNEIKALEKLKLDNLKKQFDDVIKKLDNFSKAVMPASAAMAAGFAFATKAAVDMESAMAGVQKITRATDSAIADMKGELIALSKEIPVSAVELAKITESASRLGIEDKNLKAFTRTMADMGATSMLAGEQAASTFAQFANITKMPQENIDRLASSVFELGATMATDEPKIADMALKIASAGTAAKMSQADIVGLSAGLSALGLEAQAGGTAMSKAINSITLAVETGNADLQKFASVAGMSADAFAASWRDNAAGALVTFLEGLSDTERQGKSTVALLDELGITEVRLADTLRRAAGAGDLMRNAIVNGNKAWEENTALSKAAEVQYDTTASKMELFKNEVTALGIELGDRLLPMLTGGVEALGDLVKWLGDTDEATGGLITKLGLLIAALGPGAKAVSMLVGAVKALTVAMSANPIGLWVAAIAAAVAVITALVAAFVTAHDKAAQYARSTKALTTATDEYTEAAKRAQSATEDLAEAEQLNTREKAIQLELQILATKLKVADTQKSIAEAEAENTRLSEDSLEKLTTANALKEKYLDLQELVSNEELTETERSKRIMQIYEEASAIAGKRISDEIALGQAINNNTSAAEKNSKAVEKNNNIIDEGTKMLSAQEQGALALVQNGYMPLEDAAVKSGISIERLTELLNESAAAEEAAADSTSLLADAFTDADEGAAALSGTLGDLLAATSALASESDKLASALEEQQKTGELSVKTALSLIEAGYAAALAIDEETGAVRLNKEALDDLYNAKLAEQQLSIMAQSSELVSRMEEERSAARELEKGFLDLIDANLAWQAVSSTRREIEELDKMSTMLDKLRDPSRNRTTGGGSGGSGGSGGKTKEKTQDDRDLEAYRELLKRYEHERAMSSEDAEVAEAEYREREKAARDQFLRDGVEAHRDALWKSLEAEKQYEDKLAGQREKAAEAERAAASERLEGQRKRGELESRAYWDERERINNESFARETEQWLAGAHAIAQGRAADRLEEYQEERADLKDQLDRRLISEERFYEELKRLQSVYLQEGSAEWKKVRLELFQWDERQHEETLKREMEETANYYQQMRALQDAQKKEKEDARKTAERNHQRRVAQIDEELRLEKERLQAIIDGVDRELAAREKLKEEHNYDKKIAEAELMLLYARGGENEAAAEKELLRLKNERSEWEYRKNAEDTKQAARDAISMAETSATSQKDASQKQIVLETTQILSDWRRLENEARSEYSAELAQKEKERQDAYLAHMDKLQQGAKDAALAASAGASGIAGASYNTSSNYVDNRSFSASPTVVSPLTSGQMAAAFTKMFNQLMFG